LLIWYWVKTRTEALLLSEKGGFIYACEQRRDKKAHETGKAVKSRGFKCHLLKV